MNGTGDECQRRWIFDKLHIDVKTINQNQSNTEINSNNGKRGKKRVLETKTIERQKYWSFDPNPVLSLYTPITINIHYIIYLHYLPNIGFAEAFSHLLCAAVSCLFACCVLFLKIE